MAERGTLAPGEPHPAVRLALQRLRSFPLSDLLAWQEVLASTAIEGNRMAEVCAETLRRFIAGEPVSDRYLLGLVCVLRDLNSLLGATDCTE